MSADFTDESMERIAVASIRYVSAKLDLHNLILAGAVERDILGARKLVDERTIAYRKVLKDEFSKHE